MTVHRSGTAKKPFILKRNWVIFFCFSGCFIDFLLRFNLSVAMVEIEKEQVPCRNQTELQTVAGLSSDAPDELSNHTNGSLCLENKYNYGEYWKSQFLAAYFYGDQFCFFIKKSVTYRSLRQTHSKARLPAMIVTVHVSPPQDTRSFSCQVSDASGGQPMPSV